MTMMNVAPKVITVSEIKIKAKALGIDGSKMKKTELVHAIQKAEGCTPCYGRSTGNCPWTQCCWRSDCFKGIADEETFTEEQYIRFLSLAPTDLLVQVGNDLMADFYNLAIAGRDKDSPDVEIVGIMLTMLAREYEMRQIEPLWRKAQRFAIRNSDTFKQVGKIAACIGAGAILGVSLDNS